MNPAGLGMPTREYFTGNRFDPKLLAYKQYIYEVAVLLGATPTTAYADAKMLVNFEIELARVMYPRSIVKRAMP